MKKVIATIRLGHNQVGFYDKYTGIYLTQMKPTAEIFAGMNTTQIRKSLASKRIILVSGSLDNSSLPIMKAEKIQKKTEVVPTVNTVPNTEKPVMEQSILEEITAPIEATPKKKKKRAAEKVEEPVAEQQEVAVEAPERVEEAIVTIE